MPIGASAYPGPQQLAFDFYRAPQRPLPKRATDNLYFAVLPDPEAARRMTEVGARFRDRYGLPGRVQPAHLLHISLAHVGLFAGLPAPIVSVARRAGAGVRMAPFEVSFDRAIGFSGGQHPLVLCCSRGDGEFAELRKAIAGAMLHTGFRADPSVGLTPHVTLVYNGLTVPPTMLDQPISWTVRELVLVDSLQGRSRHVHLGRWPLQA